MKMLKRVFSVVMVLAMILSFVGAAPSDTAEEQSAGTAEAAKTESAPAATSAPVAASAPAEKEAAVTAAPDAAEEQEPAAVETGSGDTSSTEEVSESSEGSADADTADEQTQTEPAADAQAEGDGSADADASEPSDTDETTGDATDNEAGTDDETGTGDETGEETPAPDDDAQEEPEPDVVPENVTVQWNVSGGLTYSGSPKAVTATLSGTGAEAYAGAEVAYEYVGADGTSYGGTAPINAGDYKVTATWTLDGQAAIRQSYAFTIAPKAVTFTVSAVKTYNGAPVVLSGEDVSDGGQLAAGDAVESITTNAVDRGTYAGGTGVTAVSCVIRNAAGEAVQSNYTVSLSGTLTINALTLTGEAVSAEDVTYNGKRQEVEPTVTYDGHTLPGSDFRFTWSWNTTNVGEVQVTVRAASGNCVFEGGSVQVTYNILPLDISEAEVAGLDSATYTGTAHYPQLRLTYEGTRLYERTDYTVTYDGKALWEANFTDVGDIEVVITGQGNFTGTRTEIYTIAGISLEDVTVSEPENVVFNGEPHTPKVTVRDGYRTLTEGTDYVLEYADNIEAGTATVIVKAAPGSNYSGTKEANFTIEPLALTADSLVNADENDAGYVYDGADHAWKPELVYKKGYVEGSEPGTDEIVPDTGFTVSYVREGEETETGDLASVGVIHVTVTCQGSFTGEFTDTYEIVPSPLTISAAGKKLFGAADPAVQVVAAPEEGTEPEGDNWFYVMVDGVAAGDEELFDGVGDDDILTVQAERVKGEDQELPGQYDISVQVAAAAESANYTVTAADQTFADAFTISPEPAFDVVLGDAEDAAEITTHTVGKVAYQMVGGEGAELIPDLQEYVTLSLLTDTTAVENNYVTPDAEDAAVPNIPTSIPQDEQSGEEGGLAGSFTIPAINYSAAGEDGHTMTWQSGLPAGTVLTIKAVSNDGAVEALCGEPVTVTSVDAYMTISTAAGAGMVPYLDGDPYGYGRVLLDGNGTVTVSPSAESAGAVGADDWIVLKVGGRTYHYSGVSYSELMGVKPAEDGSLVLTVGQLMALAGASGAEGGWFGGNPAGSLTVSAVLLDGINHLTATAAVNTAFDTAGVNTTQTVENRTTDEMLALTIGDSVNEMPISVSGTFGGVNIQEDVAAVTGMNGTMTWNNVNKWMTQPSTLPHSGSTVTITYHDCVGNPVTHTLNIVPSAAVTQNTVYVKPITDSTVPSGKLVFYGDTNVWEQLELSVGGSVYTIAPIAGGEAYDNSVRQWTQTVDLSDTSFPVGKPTAVSVGYSDLTGGDATIVITYKDEAQTPVLGSEAVVGSGAVWGYVESSASVIVDVNHADGTVSAVPASNVAVDQFGYFYARLDAPLAEGDVVAVTTTDFCGNSKRVDVPAKAELAGGAVAEVLGANIIGRTASGAMAHRFAAPIDLSGLQAGGQGFELPILAYKGIEIGRVKGALTEQGQLQLTYSISAVDYVPAGGHARVSTYNSIPSIDDLVSGTHDTAVADLKAVPEGTLASIDVSAKRNADGSYSGLVWLYADFDVDMDEAGYISRGGRGTNFYRWLTESKQTEGVLNAAYSSTAAYTDNVAFYDAYQRYESIARQFS